MTAIFFVLFKRTRTCTFNVLHIKSFSAATNKIDCVKFSIRTSFSHSWFVICDVNKTMKRWHLTRELFLSSHEIIPLFSHFMFPNSLSKTTCVTAQCLLPPSPSPASFIADYVRSLRLKVIPRSHDTPLCLILQHQYYIKVVSTEFLIFARSFEIILQTMTNHFSMQDLVTRSKNWRLEFSVWRGDTFIITGPDIRQN